MKKRIISLLLAVITVMQIVPWAMLPIIAEGEETADAITIEDMEVGKLYTAEFVSDEFWPYARFPFESTYDTQGVVISMDEVPETISIIRKSADDLGLVYIADDSSEWLGEYSEYRYIEAYRFVIDSGISVDEMEIGKAYSATWNTSDTGVAPYRKTDEKGAEFYEYGFFDDKEPNVSTDGFPDKLTVKLVYEDDVYVYVTNEDWPAAFDQYRYLDTEFDIVITGEYVEPEDDGYVYGKVSIDCDEAVGNTVTLDAGEKLYAFTSLDAEISENAKYQWQIKLEDGRWATIGDYIYPYAVLSEALLVNAPGGVANIRCVAIDGNKKYASDELALRMKPAGDVTEQLSSVTVDSYNAIAPAQKLAADDPSALSVDAFQIVINYTFRHETQAPLANIDGFPAANTFTVTLPAGGQYTGNVPSPSVVGYAPYVLKEQASFVTGGASTSITYDGKEYVPANSISFNEVKTETTVDVFYIPQEVNFLVKIYEQNLHNDEYVLAATEVKNGLSDSPVGEGLDVERTGFSPLYYDPEIAINGDGTTVIEIYYDRNYYLVDFELTTDEAYGATPYYVRYNTQVMLPTPTRPGYSFTEWTLNKVYTLLPDDSENVVTDSNVLALYNQKEAGKLITVQHNADYTAGWNIATTTYTVIYWLENADDNNFTLTTFRVIENAIPGSVINASDVQDTLGDALAAIGEDGEEEHFVFLEGVSDTQVSVKGDGTTAVNVYYARKYYTINFTSTGRCAMYVENGNANYSHTHGTDCERDLLCSKEVHTHTDACGEKTFICEMAEHTAHNGTCCTRKEHTHTTECYDNIESTTAEANNSSDIRYAPNNPVDGQIYRRGNWYNRVIYINGSWYRYGGTENSGTVISPNSSCVGYEHSHGDGNCACSTSLHTHGDTCYEYASCDKIAHTHIDGCYGQCKLYEHTCGTNCSNANRTNSVKVVTQKYDSDISKIWPIIDASGTNHQGYVWESSITGDYYSILYKMPDSDMTMSRYQFNGSTQLHWYYALERLTPTTEYDGGNYVTNGGKYYYVAFETYLTATTGTNLTYDEDYFPITGFTQLQTKNQFGGNNWTTNNGYREMYLYYVRNEHNLIFYDGEREIKSTPYLYEASLANAFFVPESIPLSKEQGSVKFVGWYTTPTCADGTEFDFANEIMPDRDVTLYAKWEDCSYTANIYLDPNKDTLLGEAQTVLFGSPIVEPDYKAAQAANPAYTNLIFAGWYYMDGDEEKRFDFNTMVLKADMDIYAKWTSKVPVNYTVYFVVDINGERVEIADPVKGQSLAGISKSFTAKTGSELYTAYQKGYFPDKRSTSIMMSNTEVNEAVFVYSVPGEIHYSVTHEFVSDDFVAILGTNKLVEVFDHKIEGTNIEQSAASVTVSFREGITVDAIAKAAYDQTGINLTSDQKNALWDIVVNLSPDHFEHDIILSTTETNNETFKWVSRGTVGTYQIIHYFETLGGEYVSDYTQEFVGNIDATVTAEAIERYGFTLNSAHKDAISSGTIQKMTVGTDGQISGGLVLKLYYSRNKYSYKVHHYEIGTTQKLAVSETVENVPFETVVTVSNNAENISGYTLANGSTTVEIVGDGQEIICYYQGLDVQYRYQIIGSTGGSLTEYIGDTVVGSVPKKTTLSINGDGFFLNRWYYTVSGDDKQKAVPDEWLSGDGMTLAPTAPGAEWAGKTITVYAEILPTTRTFVNVGLPENSTQAVVYRLKGKDETATAGVDVTFTIIGNGSAVIAILPYGEYTVTVLDWAWRYADPSVTFNGDTFVSTTGSFDLTLDAVGDVTFTFSGSSNNQWLTDDANGTVTATQSITG